MDIFSILCVNSGCVCAVAIVVTIVALVISTRCSIRNLFGIRNTSSSSAHHGMMATESDDNASTVGRGDDYTYTSDAAGNEGDDEAEVDDDSRGDGEVCQNFSGKSISPRYPDPVEYCEHIQGEIKRVQQSVATKSITKSLSEQQLQEERELQKQQLAEIFRLMQEQEDKFGIGSIDDMQEQMKLYAV